MAKSFSREKSPAENWIWGEHALAAAIELAPELMLEVQIENEEAAGPRAPQSPGHRIFLQATKAGLRLSRVPRLPRFLEEKRHQGVAAKLKYFPLWHWSDVEKEIEEAFAKPRPLHLVALDGIQDPRNYGAVLRSAAAFGVTWVFVRTRHQAPLTGVVAQASAGQLFRVQVVEMSNFQPLIDLCAKSGVKALALDAEGLVLEEALKAHNREFPLLWLVGSEGEGLRQGLLEQCQRVRISMQEGVESLNASVAAGLAFYEGWKALRG